MESWKTAAAVATFLSLPFSITFYLEDISMASRKFNSSNDGAIIRLRDHHEIQDSPICRTTGFLNPANLLALFEETDLTANPRLPRVNDQVREMWKVIEERPSSFRYKNNGILVAASACEPLERGRFRIKFDPVNSEQQPRGILNGGHTTLACVSSLVRQAASVKGLKIPRFKLWEEFRYELWPEWRSAIYELIEELNEFHVPVEVLFPTVGQTEEFDSLIHDIADARNNNCELTEEAKANHAGYYTELKAAMPDDFVRDAIEWRTNDGGRIKVKDVVSLACIPLSVISEQAANVRIDVKQCYNSTARCSAYFNEIYQAVACPKDAQYILKDDEQGHLVASDVALTRELIDLYDWFMIEFPRAYNRSGGKFGNIEGVRGSDDSASYATRYHNRPCEFNFSDGFFMPILTSVTLLIDRDADGLRWAEPPVEFMKRNLDRVMKTFKGFVRNKGYDGRLVGRDQSAYELAYETLSMIREMETLQEQMT